MYYSSCIIPVLSSVLDWTNAAPLVPGTVSSTTTTVDTIVLTGDKMGAAAYTTNYSSTIVVYQAEDTSIHGFFGGGPASSYASDIVIAANIARNDTPLAVLVQKRLIPNRKRFPDYFLRFLAVFSLLFPSSRNTSLIKHPPNRRSTYSTSAIPPALVAITSTRKSRSLLDRSRACGELGRLTHRRFAPQTNPTYSLALKVVLLGLSQRPPAPSVWDIWL